MQNLKPILATAGIALIMLLAASSTVAAHDCQKTDCPPPVTCQYPALVLCSMTTSFGCTNCYSTTSTQFVNGTTVYVVTTDFANKTLYGNEVELWQDGRMLASCFSSCSFKVYSGETYSVAVADYQNFRFAFWSTGNTDRFYTFTTGITHVDLQAIYHT